MSMQEQFEVLATYQPGASERFEVQVQNAEREWVGIWQGEAHEFTDAAQAASYAQDAATLYRVATRVVRYYTPRATIPLS